MAVAIDLRGQTALVTGGSTGIGRATVRTLADAGCDVAVHFHRSRSEADAAVGEVGALGRRAVAVQGDFSHAAAVRTAVQRAAEFLGGIDILVNNAGSLIDRLPLDAITDAHWEAVIALNLSSVFYACQAALPHLRPKARIVNVTSIAAHTGGGAHSFPYAAAKGGVLSLTRGLARELADRGIRVNAVSPGTILTPFHERFSTPERLEGVRQTVVLGRLGEARECADTVLFLVSPLAAYLTGEAIEVNGGQHFA